MGNLWSQQSKKLIILRGLPGSGKSTLANQLNETYDNKAIIYSTDDFFISNGEFKLDLRKIKEAHTWNLERTIEAMKNNNNVIILNNCNAKKWEAKSYVEAAALNNYSIDIQEPNTSWKFDVDELVKRSNSRHSPKFIKKMKDEWEDDFTILNILNSEKPKNKYKLQ